MAPTPSSKIPEQECWANLTKARQTVMDASRAPDRGDDTTDIMENIETAIEEMIALRPANRKLLRQVINLEKRRFTERMLAEHGADPFHHIQTSSNVVAAPFAQHLQTGNTDALAPLVEAGIPVLEDPAATARPVHSRTVTQTTPDDRCPAIAGASQSLPADKARATRHDSTLSLTDTFTFLCRAIAHTGADYPRILARLTDAARKTLPGCDDIPGTLDAALHSRNPDMIRAVFDRFPEEHRWNYLCSTAEGTTPGTLAYEMRTDCLDVLVERGVHVIGFLNKLVEEAHRNDRGDVLDWFDRTTKGHNKTPWPPKSLHQRLLDCGPGRARNLHARLLSRVEKEIAGQTRQGLLTTPLHRGLMPNGVGKAHPKEIAALICLGRDITPIFGPRLEHLGPRVRELVEATASAHGRMFLKSLEPDPERVLGRHKSGVFFGLAGTW